MSFGSDEGRTPMRGGKGHWIAELLSLSLLWAGTTGSASVGARAAETLGTVGWQRTVIRTAAAAPAPPLTRQDLRRMSEALDGRMVAGADAGPVLDVGTVGRSVAARVLGVSWTYGEFLFHPMRQGTFFDQAAETAADRVAVIGSDLAWQVFLTREVAGEELLIDDHRFRIVGVYEGDTSLLGTLTADGLSRVYVPLGTARAGPLTEIQVAGADAAEAEAGLRRIGRSLADFTIRDIAQMHVQAEQRGQIVVFLTSLAAAVFIMVIAVRLVSWLVGELKRELRELWFWQAVRRRIRAVFGTVAGLAGCAGLLVVLWELSRFPLFVPSEYVPDRLIQLDYFVALFRRATQEANALRGVAPTFEMLLAERVAQVQNTLFLGGLAGGALFMHVRSRQEPGAHALAVGVELIGALLVVLAACLLAGFAPSVRWAYAFVIAVFCSLATLWPPAIARARRVDQ